MAEYGAWNRKGATLSDVTALKEYGVRRGVHYERHTVGRLGVPGRLDLGNPYSIELAGPVSWRFSGWRR